VLPEFTGVSIAKAPRAWSDGPLKAEQEKLLKEH
jgi:hypothetical protein